MRTALALIESAIVSNYVTQFTALYYMWLLYILPYMNFVVFFFCLFKKLQKM